MTNKKLCCRCWSDNVSESKEDSTKLICNNCGTEFVKPESNLPIEEQCVICGAKRMSKTSKTCSFSCAAILAHQTGIWGVSW